MPSSPDIKQPQATQQDIFTLRQSLRQNARRERKQTPPNVRRDGAHNLIKTILSNSWFKSAQHIALYLPSDGEIDPTGIIPIGESLGKTFYLPILHPMRENRLWFAPFSIKPRSGYRQHKPTKRPAKLVANRFNIPEPDCHPCQYRSVYQLDLLLMPLVGFSPSGERLGMGGGFYDKTLRNFSHFPNPKRVGIAFEQQKLEIIPTFQWDVPLDGVITDKRTYCFNTSTT